MPVAGDIGQPGMVVGQREQVLMIRIVRAAQLQVPGTDAERLAAAEHRHRGDRQRDLELVAVAADLDPVRIGRGPPGQHRLEPLARQVAIHATEGQGAVR